MYVESKTETLVTMEKNIHMYIEKSTPGAQTSGCSAGEQAHPLFPAVLTIRTRLYDASPLGVDRR